VRYLSEKKSPEQESGNEVPNLAPMQTGKQNLIQTSVQTPIQTPIQRPALLVADSMALSFGGFRALDGASLSFPSGQITGIVGPNGAGKSSLLNVLAGTLAPDTGEVVYDGQRINGWPMHRRAQHGLIRTFQLARELRSLTVLENLLLAVPDQKGEGIFGALFSRASVRRTEAASIRQASELLRRVGLETLADAPADALSGGQKKLLELCRVLMLRPRMVLLDEPAAGVNPVRVAEISHFILQLKAEGVSFVIVEHNMEMIATLCDSVYVMAEGKVLAHGSYHAVSTDPRVVEAYLGSEV
jgi:branched-chain amino acid transport system ATP-binding protein/neutral amino acid transport system ATP-binding protein